MDMMSLAAVRPTRLSEEVAAEVEALCEKMDVESMRMVSMAGHDAMSIARVAPAGLFFIPSLKGVSHRPDEDSRREDIKLAGDLMYRWALAAVQRVL